jgi:hypothetical protein
MLTREAAWHEQRDLLRLCAERQDDALELFPWNGFYGHAAILKAVTGLAADRPLFVTLPHGVTYRGTPNQAETSADIATAYSYQREYDGALSLNGYRALIRGAAPFTYVPDLVGSASGARAGTLYFPSHSTRFSTADAEYDVIADQLARLPASCGPVRACCYYLDILRGHHRPFLERGIEVVSAGHQLDPLFLLRLWHLLTSHDHVMSNSHGTHMAYAMFAGCSFTYWSTGNLQCRTDPGYEDWVVYAPPMYSAIFETLYADGAKRVDFAARQTALDFIGASRKLPIPLLRHALQSAERREVLRRSSAHR